MDAETLKQFVDLAQREVPGFRVAFKDESLTQRVLAFLVSPYNTRYKHRCSSYFGTLYFPSRATYLANPTSSFSMVASEFVRVWDAAHDKFYLAKYLCPQILTIVPLAVYVYFAGAYANVLWLVLASYVVGIVAGRGYRPAFFVMFFFGLAMTLAFSWHFVGPVTFLLAGLGLAAPWPSPWRTQYELNNYTMNVALVQWFNGSVSDTTKELLVSRFVGAEHYFMCSDRLYVTRKLEMNRQQAQAGVLQRVKPFGLVFDFLYWRRLLHRMRQKT